MWEVEKKRGLWKAVPLELKNELEVLHNSNTKTVIPLNSSGYTSYKVCWQPSQKHCHWLVWCTAFLLSGLIVSYCVTLNLTAGTFIHVCYI